MNTERSLRATVWVGMALFTSAITAQASTDEAEAPKIAAKPPRFELGLVQGSWPAGLSYHNTYQNPWATLPMAPLLLVSGWGKDRFYRDLATSARLTWLPLPRVGAELLLSWHPPPGAYLERPLVDELLTEYAASPQANVSRHQATIGVRWTALSGEGEMFGHPLPVRLDLRAGGGPLHRIELVNGAGSASGVSEWFPSAQLGGGLVLSLSPRILVSLERNTTLWWEPRDLSSNEIETGGIMWVSGGRLGVSLLFGM